MQVDIAVIGGGFSAVATVINVLDRLGQDKSIALVSRSSGLGRGVAYSTTEAKHRLNVPAGRMSLLADKADHLCQWLAEEATEFGPEDFIPGSYMVAICRKRWRTDCCAPTTAPKYGSSTPT
ncbi:FAD/NAD(P)-binding protein [Rhizobium sp. G21]|nr:FAD/NAD(P)-binding protein [Rhizobium sp. G21]MBB1250989.1 FAD/NAD(P)-binding protein [Rhizobium sp. G21]